MIISFSAAPATTSIALVLLLALGLSFTSAQPIDPNTTVTLSFFTVSNDPVPNASPINVQVNTCVEVPSLAYSFSSSSNQSVFALYRDDGCRSYLYSVEGLLENLHGARSLIWVDIDQSQSHIPGETFTDPAQSQESTQEERRAHLIQVIVISLSSAIVFIGLGICLCYVDNHRNRRRGGYVPEPSSPIGYRNMAEVSGPGPSIYQYNNSHYRDANSTASSISFLPPYGHGAYSKSTVTGCDSVTPPEEVFIANSSSQKIGLSTRCELPMTRTRSISNLTNQVGTGAGLDPGSVQQGRNAGFGLGYDLEENRKRDSRRDSDITLGNAIMTPPHSPMLRPSSVTLDDNGQVIGRGGILMPA